MKKSITSGQEKQFKRLIRDAAERAAELALKKVDPDKEGLQQFLAQGDKLKSAIAEVVIAKTRELSIASYFIRLSDAEVPEQYQSLIILWRKLAAILGYNGPIAWRVSQGFTLKCHAPQIGPCYKNWEYLQDWNLQNDEPTKKSFIFWIPCLVPESTGKTVQEQIALLTSLRERVGLPAHHLKSFGSVALISGLILSHFKLTGESVPMNQLWTRTDTLHVDGFRLNLGVFDSNDLYCDDWNWDDVRCGSLGCFALGEELGL